MTKKQQKVARQQRNARIEGLIPDARLLFGFADSETARGRRELRNAAAKAKRALLLDPENYEALVLLGNIYLALDGEEAIAEALRYLDQAIALQPGEADAYDSKAHALMYYVDRPEEAERYARKAVSLAKTTAEDPEFLKLYYMTLIDILILRKKYGKARWMIRRAIRDCPGGLMTEAAKTSLKEIESAEIES